ncbi:MAG: hypothetical protein RR382_05345 [Tannerellaceae bacterium]
MDEQRDWTTFLGVIRNAVLLTQKGNMTEEALRLYFNVMREYRIEQVQEAVAMHLRSDDGRFFPTPAHLIRQIEGSETERAHLAWRVFLKALEKYGYYDSVRFPLPAYHYAIYLLGGWIKISAEYGELTDKEIEFRRGVFTTLYMRGERESSFGKIPGKIQVAPYLKGFYEVDNEQRGYMEVIPPVVEVETGRFIKQCDLPVLGGELDDIIMLQDKRIA